MKIRKPVIKEKKPKLLPAEKSRRNRELKALRWKAQEIVMTWLKSHVPEAQEIVTNVRRITKLKKGWTEQDLKQAKSDLTNYAIYALGPGVIRAQAALDELASLGNGPAKGVSEKDSNNKVLNVYGMIHNLMENYGLEPAQIATIAYSLATNIGCLMLRQGAEVAPECKAVAFCMAATDYVHQKPEWVKPMIDEMLETNFADLHAMMTVPEPFI